MLSQICIKIKETINQNNLFSWVKLGQVNSFNYLYHRQNIICYQNWRDAKHIFIIISDRYNNNSLIMEGGLLKEEFAEGYKLLCGLYARDRGLLKPEKERMMVPLKTCEYHMEIVNAMVNITLTQVYKNPSDKFLEMEYSFPISPNACVYRFVADFGNSRIEGIVKQKQEAKKEYEQAIKVGKQAAYGELDSNSKDILNLKVGNVAPNQQVKIQIVYMQELSLSYNTFYQLHLPGTISPRYMSHLPEPMIRKGCKKQGGMSIQGDFTWTFRISLRTTRKVVFFDSHTHDIELVNQNDTCTVSNFAMTNSCVPNKDFVFSYTTTDYELPNYVFGRTDVSSSAMLSFIPKFCNLAVDDAYKASVKGTPYESEIQNSKGEYIFLLDRSGSMGGKRIQKAKEALILFIKSLPQDTYFNVVSFGTGSSLLFPKSRKYNDKDVDLAVKQVKIMQADMGGTQILQPLINLLKGQLIEGYPKQIFLLTDGGVSDTEKVLRMVSINNKWSRVHTIGIGNGASEQLIIGCAKKGKGYHTFITDAEEPSEKIIQLLTDSLSPVISKIKLDFDPNIVESVIPNPQSFPYILKGEIANFYVTFKGQLDKKTTLSFSYQDSQNKLPYKSDIEIDPQSPNESFIDRMGHFKKIRLLEDSNANGSNVEEMMFYVKNVDKKAEIIKESVTNQILSEFTAFVCVEKELIDGKYQQIKEIGKIQVNIENPKPVQFVQKNRVLKKMGMVVACSNRNKGIEGAREDLQKMKKKKAIRSQHSEKVEIEQRASMLDKQRQKCIQRNPQIKKGGEVLRLQTKRQIENEDEGEKSNFLADRRISGRSNYGLQINKISSIKMEQQDKEQQFLLFCKKKQKNKKMEKNVDKSSDTKQQFKMSQSSLMIKGRQLQQVSIFAKKEKAIQKSVVAITISEVINCQSTDGSWKDIGLFERLFTKQIATVISAQKDVIAVITYLIAKWIEKNHPQKQYLLVIKKGMNFAKKQSPNFDKFGDLYDQYLV